MILVSNFHGLLQSSTKNTWQQDLTADWKADSSRSAEYS